MTRTRTRLALVGIALLLVSSIVPPSGGFSAIAPSAVGTASAAEHSFAVEQGGECWEVSPLRGDEDVATFYDYRNVENTDGSGRYTYSSFMPEHLTREDASRLFLYEGPDGVSLVMVHNARSDGRDEGSAATFRFSGLPSGGDWAVEDDDYSNQDDRFSRTQIDWSWYGDRTDGAAFRGLDRDGTAVTIDPAFDEEAALYDSPVQREGTTRAWEFLTGSLGDPSAVSLDLDRPVTIRTGTCGPDETAPNAALSAGDGLVGQSVTFDARDSTDEGGSQLAEYQWDFDGDGEAEQTGSDPTVTHAYDEAGTYDATVTVVDGAGNADAASAQVEIEADDPPEAAFSVGDSPTAGFPVALDASNSTDERGIAEYQWDFDGDGEAEQAGSDPTVSHTFEESGDREVALTVVDSGGRNATTTRTVSVGEDGPPEAAIRVVSPENPVAGEEVVLSASNSTDDTGIESYRWNVTGGGAATGERVAFAFAENGTVEVTLEVVDEGGNNATASAEIEVLVRDETPPSAELSASTNRTKTGDRVTFDASNSTDEGGSGVAEYRWDFDGDGEVNRTTQNPTVQHDYGEAGNYTATVVVADGRNNTDDATVPIRVDRNEKAHDGNGGNGGNRGGGNSGGGNSGGNNANTGGSVSVGEPPVQTETEAVGPNRGLVDVRSAKADETVKADLPASEVAESSGVRFRTIAMDLASDDSHFVVETARTPADSAAANGSAGTDGSATRSIPADVRLGSLSVDARFVESGQVEQVAYEIGVERSRLADAGVAPADLRAYQRAGETWTQVNSTVVERGETVVLRVRTDGFEPVALGADKPVTVASADLAAESVRANEPVAVNATLHNEGDERATVAANLTADGEVVATESVAVPAGESKRVTVEATLSPGTHALALDGESVGNVTVAEPAPDLGVAAVSLNDSAVRAGEQVAITATVENQGSEAGERTVGLTLFGEEVATKSVEVPAGETKRVTFVRSVDAAGNYTATVGNSSATLEVTERESADDDSAGPGVPIPGFGAGVAVVAMVAALLVAMLAGRNRR